MERRISVDAIWELLSSGARWFWDAVGTMIDRLVSEPSYRDGFGACFVTIVILGALSSAISWAWALVHKFFSATKAPPAPGAGPTPAGITGGCVQGIIVLSLLALLAAYMLSRLIFP